LVGCDPKIALLSFQLLRPARICSKSVRASIHWPKNRVNEMGHGRECSGRYAQRSCCIDVGPEDGVHSGEVSFAAPEPSTTSLSRRKCTEVLPVGMTTRADIQNSSPTTQLPARWSGLDPYAHPQILDLAQRLLGDSRFSFHLCSLFWALIMRTRKSERHE